jgi:hypothetical protein
VFDASSGPVPAGASRAFARTTTLSIERLRFAPATGVPSATPSALADVVHPATAWSSSRDGADAGLHAQRGSVAHARASASNTRLTRMPSVPSVAADR